MEMAGAQLDAPATLLGTYHCIITRLLVSPAKPCLLPPALPASCVLPAISHPLASLRLDSGQSSEDLDQPWAHGCIAAF